MNHSGFELTTRGWTATTPPIRLASQPVLYRVEPLQPEVDALVVLVVNVIMHARFERINAACFVEMEVLGF